MLSDLKRLPLWDEVSNSADYSGLRGDDEIASEVIATYSGRRGSARLQRELERSAEMGDWDSVSVYKRVVDGLREMWERVIDWFSGSGLLGRDRLAQYHVDEFCDSMLSDLMGDAVRGDEYGVFDDARFSVGEDVRADTEREMQEIRERAVADGTFMKAPNGKPTRLNERQWLQVRTKAFKKWFGDWEKAARIEKLKNSNEVDVKYNGEYSLTAKDAQVWIKENLRGEYKIEDTNEIVQLSKVGADEVTSHNRLDEVHLKSISAIPDMLNNAVFITEEPNTKNSGKFDSYRYYVVGLNIDGISYTAKIVIGVKQGKRYYDHRLTQIEKSRLIDYINQPTFGFTTEGNASLPPYAVGKDTKLISILQTNSSKVVDDNGEPLVVYHGSNWNPLAEEKGHAVFNKQDIENGGYWFSSQYGMSKSYGEHVTAVFLNIRKAMTIDAESRNWNDVLQEYDGYEFNPIENARIRKNRGRITLEFDRDGNKEAKILTSLDELKYLINGADNIDDIVKKISNGEKGYLEIKGDTKIRDNKIKHLTTRDIVARAFNNGNDGAVITRISDYGGKSKKLIEDIINLKIAGKDFDNTVFVAFHPNQIKSAMDNVGTFDITNPDIRYSIREGEAPKNTGIGYKVFVLKNGKLYPPMVSNPNGDATPVGVWLDADAAPIAGQSKTGRSQVKAGGKGTQGGSGRLAYRPGWHLGKIPYALQFNRNDENGERTLFPANFVWAEVEYANDVDYQEDAMSYGYNKNGKFQHSYAGLPRVPENGSYTYRTNPNPETDPWIITGAMRVKRLLTPTEVDEMVKAAGREPQPRQEGAVTDAEIEALNAEFIENYSDDVNNSNNETANNQFNEQLDEYINGGEKANVIFKLGNPQGAMKLFLPDFPIVMRPRIINKSSKTKHNVDARSLRNLPQMISEPIFVFKRSDDALGILTEIEDRNGKNVCVAIEMNKTIQDGGTMLEVNDIRSIHGRDVANIVLPIAHNNTLVYADKTKGLNWLSSASYTYQQEIDKKDLDLVAKIVKDFENPSVEEEKYNSFSSDDVDVRFSMSPATGVSNGDVSKKIKYWLHEFRLWLRRGSGDTQVEISGRLGKEFSGLSINGLLMPIVESWSNGYISLHRVFTHLNEARVKSGLKPYDDVMDLEWRAANAHGRANGLLDLWRNIGHKDTYVSIRKSVERVYGNDKKDAKMMLDDYLMARSMLERIDEFKERMEEDIENYARAKGIWRIARKCVSLQST